MLTILVSPSVEVTAEGAPWLAPYEGLPEPVGGEVHDVLLGLEGPGDAEERGRLCEDAEPWKHAGPEDDVDEPGPVSSTRESAPASDLATDQASG